MLVFIHPEGQTLVATDLFESIVLVHCLQAGVLQAADESHANVGADIELLLNVFSVVLKSVVKILTDDVIEVPS